jgi:hypothetical protein
VWTLGGRRKWGDLDGKSEVLQAMDEPVDVPALTPFVEVIGTEVFIEGSALQHFIGGGEDRSGDGANETLTVACGPKTMLLGLIRWRLAPGMVDTMGAIDVGLTAAGDPADHVADRSGAPG